MTDGFHQAALRLNTLSSTDRTWILQQLESEQKDRLDSLLAELKQLGIKSDEGTLDEMSIDELHRSLLDTAHDRESLRAAIGCICQANHYAISDLIGAEPDWMIAAICCAYPWPWRVAFLAALPIDKRQRIEKAIHQTKSQKQRPREELILAIAVCLQQHDGGNHVPFDVLIDTESNRQKGSYVSQPFWRGLKKWLP